MVVGKSGCDVPSSPKVIALLVVHVAAFHGVFGLIVHLEEQTVVLPRVGERLGIGAPVPMWWALKRLPLRVSVPSSS